MTKKDIALKVADKTGIKQIIVKQVLQGIFDCIIESLLRDEKIELRNFGVFQDKNPPPAHRQKSAHRTDRACSFPQSSNL